MTPQEFNDLVNVYRSKLVRSAVYKWGDIGEDAIQEALLLAYKNLHQYDHSYTFTTWVFTIAKRLIYNWNTKKQLNIDHDIDVFDLTHGNTPETIVSGRQFAELLEDLPPAQFEAIVDKMDGVVPKNRQNLVRARKRIHENI